jgi:hypothetical protein
LDIAIDPKSYFFPWKNYMDSLHQCVKKYTEKFSYCENLSRFGVCEPYNIQHYNPGGGFKKWHYERNAYAFNELSRVIVYMTYLNNVDDAGTEWFYQNFKTKAKKGLTVMWPAEWTHTHRGIISPDKEKYIATGWLNMSLDKY